MNAPTHIKNYYKHFGLDPSDVVLCEVCKSVANDFHHVEPRSSFGSTRKKEQDAVENIIALCRQCHDDAHQNVNTSMKTQFKYHEPIKDKPLVKLNAIRAAVFCVVLVIIVGSIVWKIWNG